MHHKDYKTKFQVVKEHVYVSQFLQNLEKEKFYSEHICIFND